MEMAGDSHWVKKALESQKATIAAFIVGFIFLFFATAILKIWVLGITVVGYIALFGLALSYRAHDVMRIRRDWKTGTFISLFVSIFTVYLGYTHDDTTNGLCAYFLLAIVVSIIVLTAQPVFDYGLLLFFLRLPLQITVANFETKFSWWYVGSVGLLVMGTILQNYMLAIVNDMHGKALTAQVNATPTANGDPVAPIASSPTS